VVSILIFIRILFRFTKTKNVESRKLVAFLVAGIFGAVNFLYFTNLIPPIPLSLKDVGVYHSVQKNSEGDYSVTYEDYGWRGYFKIYPVFHEVAGTPVYAFSAIFSPKDLNVTIVHEWQRYDTQKNKWVKDWAIKLPVTGGRDGGFRTYSMRSSLAAGKWRVLIKTGQGKTIGSLRFSVVEANTTPILSTKTID
jgi:hypothetical protein